MTERKHGRTMMGGSYTILGAARSGLAAARLLRREGARVFVSDAGAHREDVARTLERIGCEFEFGGHTDRVLEQEVIVLSPGVPDTIDVVRRAIAAGLPVLSEIEVAARRFPGRIAAITGTNGKTTTTELAGFILRRAGVPTFVAGNVGLAFSEIVPEADEHSVVVLEVSSFQLEHIETFRPDVAVLLNITPDHMDRYESFGHYVAAKFRIAMNQRPEDVLVYNDDDPEVRRLPEQAASTPLAFSIEHEVDAGAFVRDGVLQTRLPKTLIGGQGNSNASIIEERMQIDQIRIRGPHNLYNAMAAALLARCFGVGDAAVLDALREFPGVAHRLEPIREIDGIRWINDSKATNVNALWYALNSFEEPIVLIAGGRSKNNDYGSVLDVVEQKVRAMVVLGEAAEEMQRAFAGRTDVRAAGRSLQEAVAIARAIARTGDVVLLSPACASFDMFDNYEHRGETFRHLVEALQPRTIGDPMEVDRAR